MLQETTFILLSPDRLRRFFCVSIFEGFYTRKFNYFGRTNFLIISSFRFFWKIWKVLKNLKVCKSCLWCIEIFTPCHFYLDLIKVTDMKCLNWYNFCSKFSENFLCSPLFMVWYYDCMQKVKWSVNKRSWEFLFSRKLSQRFGKKNEMQRRFKAFNNELEITVRNSEMRCSAIDIRWRWSSLSLFMKIKTKYCFVFMHNKFLYVDCLNFWGGTTVVVFPSLTICICFQQWCNILQTQNNKANLCPFKKHFYQTVRSIQSTSNGLICGVKYDMKLLLLNRVCRIK